MSSRAISDHFSNRPCAAKGLYSFRYQGRYGPIMIGATSVDDAIYEAERSTFPVELAKLEVWDGSEGAYKAIEDVQATDALIAQILEAQQGEDEKPARERMKA